MNPVFAATLKGVQQEMESLLVENAFRHVGDLLSEDFSEIPGALAVPYTHWGVGWTDPEQYAKAEAAGRVSQYIPANHSPHFAPVIEPTLKTGTAAVVVAALAWLASTP